MLTSVKGTYRGGKVELVERFPEWEGEEVWVLFEGAPTPARESVWQRVKQAVARSMPDLAAMSLNEAHVEFDDLSAKVAAEMPFDNVEAFERAMRGDEHGLARY